MVIVCVRLLCTVAHVWVVIKEELWESFCLTATSSRLYMILLFLFRIVSELRLVLATCFTAAYAFYFKFLTHRTTLLASNRSSNKDVIRIFIPNFCLGDFQMIHRVNAIFLLLFRSNIKLFLLLWTICTVLYTSKSFWMMFNYEFFT